MCDDLTNKPPRSIVGPYLSPQLKLHRRNSGKKISPKLLSQNIAGYRLRSHEAILSLADDIDRGKVSFSSWGCRGCGDVDMKWRRQDRLWPENMVEG